MTVRCAIWARVSTDDQDTSNQLAELRAWAQRRGLDVVREYRARQPTRSPQVARRRPGRRRGRRSDDPARSLWY